MRGELFALLTLAVTFVLATVVLNTPIDGGPGVYLSAVAVPALAPTPSGTFYLLALVLATATIVIAYAVTKARLGLGLFAIHDDEDAAEVMGVPTYRYKLVAFGVSCALAGVAGGIHALFVQYITAPSTFNITVPLTVILMSVLGGTRHWAGPALGATVITILLYASTAADQAVAGKAIVGAILVAAVLFMPDGDPRAASRAAARARRRMRRPTCRRSTPSTIVHRQAAQPLLVVRGVRKAFAGVRALDGVDLEVREGEILGMLGPNGSGKSTLINVVAGHYRADAGSIAFDGREIASLPAHRIARAGIARTYQIPRLFAHLTVRDNAALTAMFGGAQLGTGEAARARADLARVHRARRARRRAAGRAQPAPDQVPRARARARVAPAPGAARRGAVGPHARRDRRGGRDDPPHPRAGDDGRAGRARDARGHRAVGPSRRAGPGPRARRRRARRRDGARRRDEGLPRTAHA